MDRLWKALSGEDSPRLFEKTARRLARRGWNLGTWA